MNKINSELSSTLFTQREHGKTHLSYENELEFFDCIKNGDVQALSNLSISLVKDGLGVLSLNPFRNMTYHFIIAASIITRFCIENGLNAETAYTLSDLYIQKADKCTTIDELSILHKDMIYDYTKRMFSLTKKKNCSKYIHRCLEYIHEHLHETITTNDLASHLHLNGSYLCTIFKKETGLSITQYIERERVESAKNMLMYSDYSYIDISNYINFSSHSYFIKVFKKHTGMTPKEYRNNYYHSHWGNKEGTVEQ